MQNSYKQLTAALFLCSFIAMQGMDEKNIGRRVSQLGSKDDPFVQAVHLILNSDKNEIKELKKIIKNNPKILYDVTLESRNTLPDLACSYFNHRAMAYLLSKTEEKVFNIKNIDGQSLFDAVFNNCDFTAEYNRKDCPEEKMLQIFAPYISKKMIHTYFNIKRSHRQFRASNDVVLTFLNSDEFNPKPLRIKKIKDIQSYNFPLATTILLSFKDLEKKWKIKIPKPIKYIMLCDSLMNRNEVLRMREAKFSKKLELNDFEN